MPTRVHTRRAIFVVRLALGALAGALLDRRSRRRRAEAGFLGCDTRLENLIHRLVAHRRTQRLLLFTRAPRSFLARPSLLPRGFVGTARGFLALTTQLLFDARMLLLGAPIARFAALALVLVTAPRFVATPALLGFRLRLGIAKRLRLAGLLLGAPLLRSLHFVLQEAHQLLLLARHFRREELGLARGLAPRIFMTEAQVALKQLALRLVAHRLALLGGDEPLAVPMLRRCTLALVDLRRP